MLRRFIINNPNLQSDRQFGRFSFVFALWLMYVGYCCARVCGQLGDFFPSSYG